jgi:hypothetical protein
MNHPPKKKAFACIGITGIAVAGAGTDAGTAAASGGKNNRCHRRGPVRPFSVEQAPFYLSFGFPLKLIFYCRKRTPG